MLLFKKRFLLAIREGRKTQTIRLWKHRRMRSGQESYIPGVGHIVVDTVSEICVEDLTDADAAADGFDSAVALRAALREIYGKELADGYQAYRVCFRVVKPIEVRRRTLTES